MGKIAVSLSVGNKDLKPQVEHILGVLRPLSEAPFVVLATNGLLDPKGTKMAIELATAMPDVVLASISNRPGSFSTAYLDGIQMAVDNGADYIITMDADGSHRPEDIAKHMKAFGQGHPVVLGSRFIDGGRDGYPLQRIVVSALGTLLSNLILAPRGKRLTDFTSGYEGLTKEVVQKLFAALPADKWVCVTRGPYHLQNTELRTVLLTLGYEIKEVPISYGLESRGGNLKLGYILQAAKNFILLVNEKNKLRNGA